MTDDAGGPVTPLRFMAEQMQRWREALEPLQAQSGPVAQMTDMLRRQADIFSDTLRRQGEWQAHLTEALFDPLLRQAEFLSSAAARMREQAELYERSADLPRQQAELFERAAEPARRQAEVLRELFPRE